MVGWAAPMALAALLAGTPAGADEAVTTFSSGTVGQAPAPPWRATKLPKVPNETLYRLVEDDGAVVLRADANASMSGLVHPLRFDPRTRPVLEWRWKVSDVPARASFGTKQGDDFAARVYVLFDYDVAKLPLLARVKLKLAWYGDLRFVAAP